ncbi:MAG: arsenate reductase (glutaredoxin) [Rhodospirillales bacterium]|nr:arsenate reductase (glutaredoxin) [Rhodospirillales bacterium]MCB9997077.1 arsenate reductase (glutaredoxin) [Rhodospirillales bacterium]
MSITIYHNPRCSKSRQALELIRAAGHEPDIIEYLKTPPDAGTIAALAAQLGGAPQDMMRKGEAVYKELGLKETDDPGTLIRAMAAHPVLIERPLVITAKGARICRPPERVKEILP